MKITFQIFKFIIFVNFEKKYDDIKSITEKANLNLNSYFRFTNDPSLLNPSIYFFNPL